MEILIVVAIMAVVTKRGVEDILHTARGGTPHRYTAAKQRKASGAAGRYWSTLWEDTWTDMAAKHAERRDQRLAGASPEPAAKVGKPRGAATQFFAGLAQDGRRAARRSWEDGWTRLDERRRTKATRPRPGQVTVPGTVVPNAQDEDEDGRPQDGPQDGPQDEDRPDSAVVPTQDERTDLQFGDDPTDPTGTKTCPECHGTSITQDGICLACRNRQEQRNQHHDREVAIKDCRNCDGWPNITMGSLRHTHDEYCQAADILFAEPDNQTTSPLTTTQEGTTMTTTIPTGEIAGLEPAIDFFEASANAFREQAVRIEQTLATLDSLEVSGPARAAAASSMEQSQSSAGSMTLVAEELKKHRVVAEAIDATPGAGKREFYTAGR